MKDILIIETEVEEDGDEIFTSFPRWCMIGGCFGKKHRIVNKDGFGVCSVCSGSYGPYIECVRIPKDKSKLGH